MRTEGAGDRRMHVLVMAKAPVAGRVKTRLCPPCTPDEAAAIAQAALADTLDAVAGCGADAKIVALDGEPGDWLPTGIDVIAQEGDGLDERLANAWAATRSSTGGWGIQIGMDTPQVTAADLDAVLGRLSMSPGPGGRGERGQTAVIGPAEDGGWWVIGLQGTDPLAVFPGIPASTPSTGALQRRRLLRLGLRVITAPVRRDIDTVEDLRAVAAAIPHSRTALATRRALGSPLAVGA
jgi:glycosyltransferase A (GT-A) superfamily protein (DUF2064 family)